MPFFSVWKLNDKPLSCGARIVPSMDFGLVTLDITSAGERDAGVFTCIAQNASGQFLTRVAVQPIHISQILTHKVNFSNKVVYIKLRQLDGLGLKF